MNKLKLNLNDLTWTHSGEEDIGILDARSMKTITSLLRSLRTDGFIVTQVALDATLTAYLTLTYDPKRAELYLESDLLKYVTSQICGLSSNRLKRQSRESQMLTYDGSAGNSGQITTSASLEDTSSHTSTPQEARYCTTRYVTTWEIDDLRSQEVVAQSVTDSNASRNVYTTSYSPREVETLLSSGWRESLQYQYQAQVVGRCSEGWQTTAEPTTLS